MRIYQMFVEAEKKEEEEAEMSDKRTRTRATVMIPKQNTQNNQSMNRSIDVARPVPGEHYEIDEEISTAKEGGCGQMSALRFPPHSLSLCQPLRLIARLVIMNIQQKSEPKTEPRNGTLSRLKRIVASSADGE